jgi:exodeoxyribonuclease V beta subunit
LGVAQVKGDLDGKTPTVKSALSALLGRSTPDDLLTRLQAWACEDIVVQTAPAPTADVYRPTPLGAGSKAAKISQRHLASHWWSASFSALTRDLAQGPASEREEQWQDAQLDARFDASGQGGVGDVLEVSAATDLLSTEPPFNSFPAGSRYGTLVHDLLEWQAQQGWPLGSPGALADSAQWELLLARQAQPLNLEPEQVTQLADWLSLIIGQELLLAAGKSATRPLVLGTVRSSDMWPEMGFSLPVKHLSSQRLDQAITAHIWPKLARVALELRQLEGMLTGFMDLVLCHEGRYYVLDYKSNRLAAYTPQQLQQAMLAHRYDVQAVLYVLALHRLLKSRLPGYNFEQHMGGALYLFLRGIDQPGAGLVHLSPPHQLIEALDSGFRSLDVVAVTK